MGAGIVITLAVMVIAALALTVIMVIHFLAEWAKVEQSQTAIQDSLKNLQAESKKLHKEAEKMKKALLEGKQCKRW